MIGKDKGLKTIQAIEDLVIELWPAGEAAEWPVLRLRSRGAKAFPEACTLSGDEKPLRKGKQHP
jgi:hypothetical protein